MTRDGKMPDPHEIYPNFGNQHLTYVKPTIKNPNIIVGDFTYFSDADFERHVTHFYDFLGDKLIIGKFCQIGADVNFVMNGANHQMSAATTFPFYILSGWDMSAPAEEDMPFKGDTVVGNDVWIGQFATIMPGVTIGDGAVIGTHAVVAGNVPPYTIVAGNPARPIRKRLDDEMIALMEALKWWDKPVEKINALIPVLTSSNLSWAKGEIRKLIESSGKDETRGQDVYRH